MKIQFAKRKSLNVSTRDAYFGRVLFDLIVKAFRIIRGATAAGAAGKYHHIHFLFYVRSTSPYYIYL